MTNNLKTPIQILNEKRNNVSEVYDNLAATRDGWIAKNKYYYDYLKGLLKFIIEPENKVLQLKCETGQFLNAVNPGNGIGIDSSAKMIRLAMTQYPHLNFEIQDLEEVKIKGKFDYVLMVNVLGDIVDVRRLFYNIKSMVAPETRLVIINYNYLWQPIIKLAERLNLKIKQPTQNWLSINDINNLLYLAGYEIIKQYYSLLFPKYIPILSSFINKILARIPGIQKLCFVQVVIAKEIVNRNEYDKYSVSVIIPCKNEKGNVEDAARRIPQMGKHTEIIFCDDKSTDGTPEEVLKIKEKYPEKDIKLIYGPGICKSRNVWTGFDAAKGDILMILDGDLTVIPEELPYFFDAIVEGKGEFINGCRLIYPMETNAMPMFNVLGNKIFSLIFSYLLGQRIKDTLCGTKVLWKRDYLRMKKYIGNWGAKDRWGDYDLLFGANKLNLKIIDMPVHYFDRRYGLTKMTKVFQNGLIMLRMCWAALWKLKFN